MAENPPHTEQGATVRRWTLCEMKQPLGTRWMAAEGMYPSPLDQRVLARVEVVALPDLKAVLREFVEDDLIDRMLGHPPGSDAAQELSRAWTQLQRRLKAAGISLDPPPDTEETGGAGYE